MSRPSESEKILKNIKNVDDLDEKGLIILLDELCKSYHSNGNSLVDDDTYDSIKDIYEKKFGKEYVKVGAPIGTQEKKKLPKYMGSLNKIKNKKELENWKKKNPGPYIWTEKVDGVSCLQEKRNLYTRGDGIIGTNISHLASAINIPRDIGNVFVRMEIVMPKDKFEQKYKDDMANARNMVSGLVNRKHFDSNTASDLLVLSYEYDDGTEMKQSEQLLYLEKLGYKLPYNGIIKKTDDLTIENLQTILKDRKEMANYDIDGIVVFRDIPYRPVSGENPKNAIAFKMEGDCVISTVEEVEWNTSKHGLLKPRVRIVPVELCGVTITWLTGFNAKFIIDNNICKGCTIEVTRSGDVIPFIKDVIVPGDNADIPEGDWEWTKKKYMVLKNELGEYRRNINDKDLIIEIHGNEEYYVWYDDSEVDIRIKGENDEMRVQKLIAFFKKLEAKFVGESSIKKLYDTGCTTLHDFFNLSVNDICKIEGFQNKGATRIVEAIRTAITDVPLAKIAAASGIMGVGIGERKFQLVVDKHPDILEIDLPVSEMTDLVKDVGGFKTLAVHFASRLPELRMFFENHPEITLKKEKTRKVVKKEELMKKQVPIIFDDEDDEIIIDEDDRRNELDGKTVVFTGFRNKEAEEMIKEYGGKVTTSVSNKTNLLVVAKRYSGNSKEVKADQLGIEVITGDEFINRYM